MLTETGNLGDVPWPERGILVMLISRYGKLERYNMIGTVSQTNVT